MTDPIKFRTLKELYALGHRLEAFDVGSVVKSDSPGYLAVSAAGLEKLLDRLETAERESARRLGVCLRLEDAATQAADALRAAIDGPTQEIEPEPEDEPIPLTEEEAALVVEALEEATPHKSRMQNWNDASDRLRARLKDEIPTEPERTFEIGQRVKIIGNGPAHMRGKTGAISVLPQQSGGLYTLKLDDWGSTCRQASDLESLGLCGVDSGGAPDSFCDKAEGHDGLHSDGCLGIAWPSEKAKAKVRKGQRTAPSLESRVNIMGQIVELPPILCDAVIADPMRGTAHSCQLPQGHSGTHHAIEFGDWR